MTPRLWLLCVIMLMLAIWQWPESVVEHPPGVLIDSAPEQTALDVTKPFHFEAFQITPLAGFGLEARVLAKEGYQFGTEAKLSPMDLALGWQRMSSTEVLEQLEISQGGRFYYWRAKTLPIPIKQIETQSANMHIVPGNEQVRRQLDDIRVGSLIRIRGDLISVSGAEGWTWKSSLTREDTGNGACELIWVRELEIL